MTLVGRETELRACSDFLARARERFSALALVGDPGIGKTTLLAETLGAASDAIVMRARPVESEVRLSFAGLADLIREVDGSVFETLPPVQRSAVDAVLLRGDALPDGLDLRVVGAAFHSVLRALTDTQPVLIAIDDVQWLDASSAAAIGFAVRRLDVEPTGIVVTARTSSALTPVLDDRAIRVDVGPLSLAALHEVIKSELGRTFPRPVMVRLERASAGNPFYAIAIARELDSVDSAAGDLPVPSDLRTIVESQIEKLPERTRDALLVAAAHADAQQADVEALEPAEAAGIVTIRDGRVVFAHPLYASTIYSGAPTAQRRRVHRRLADAVTDPEARARHLALAAKGPDAAVADALDEAAARAARRGATDAAAELLELAEALTPRDETDVRARRAIDAADHMFAGGDMVRAGTFLERAIELHPTPDLAAEALVELATVRWMEDRLDLAESLGLRALETAQDRTLLGAIHSRMSWICNEPARAASHAREALSLLDEQDDPGSVSFALHQRVWCEVLAGRGADVEAYERGLALRKAANPDVVNLMPALWAAMHDDFPDALERYDELLRRSLGGGDAAGLTAILAGASFVELLVGRWEDAERHAREALASAEDSGQRSYRVSALCALAGVAAHRGEDDPANGAIAAVFEQLGERTDPEIEARARAVAGFLALSRGDLDRAILELTRVEDAHRALGIVEPVSTRHETDLLEALVRSGDLERARAALSALERRHEIFPRPSVRAAAMLGRGLVAAAEGDAATGASHVVEARDLYRSLSMPFAEARASLVLGVMQRKLRRRGEARASITAALDTFERLGARHWIERARTELGRSGVRTSPLQLTATEDKVARLAAQGRTNREIAEELFLSQRTVEDNLARAYRKLGIRSRAELGARLGR